MNPLHTYLHTCLSELQAIHTSGAGVKETSYYPAVSSLFNAVGKTLKPSVRCIINLKNTGAGIPDGGFFTPDQVGKAAEEALLPGLLPSRGVLEVKGAGDDIGKIVASDQVAKYWAKYGQVLVTNLRDFVLVGRDEAGQKSVLETFSLAPTEAAFWALAAHPETAATLHGERFTEYLQRALLQAAPLATPEDLAWFLASYARDAKSRIEIAGVAALSPVRAALEDALGLKFEGPKGEHFFRSTLVQTLFYGVFSAWVLWCRQHEATKTSGRFDWRLAAWELHVPMIRALFQEVAKPSQLGPLGLIEVLDWTGAALNRVDQEAFFAKFDQAQAVQYFYEPFLQAFDPELRRDLGVWYTPPEIVRYMVARVDTVLREELNLPDGLADPNVYVLDPCCGTGAYLVEVLHTIQATLAANGTGALAASDLKTAATERVFGFEILPAPFVVAHLQLGLLLQNAGAPLSETKGERAGVFLTNALTGWGTDGSPHPTLAIPEFAAERDAADAVKQKKPILVILGNPPYNSFAGVGVAEERALSTAYRTTKNAPAPQGQGLNDLYVRFFRMAERRITEGTGKGVVCFISNYSWLDGLSHTGMRERYLEAFDDLWIDSLNGDKYKTGKLTPEGLPDPSVFSTETNREGIQVGTAVALLVRKEAHAAASVVHFRHWWGKDKRAALLASLESSGDGYAEFLPSLPTGLTFTPLEFSEDYHAWPLLPDLFPAIFTGVNTSRDADIIAIDKAQLEIKMQRYFNPMFNDAEVRQIAPAIMTSSSRYDASHARQQLLQKGINSGYFVRYCYRPFDTRYAYWHPETKLLDEKREDLFAAFHTGNLFFTSRQKAERQNEGTPFFVTSALADRHLTRPGSACFPLTQNIYSPNQKTLFTEPIDSPQIPKANLSTAARAYLATFGIDNPDADAETAGLIWMHALAIGYSPAYLTENADGIRGDWPRVPLPDTRAALETSAALGRQIAALLDTETPVPGVTTGPPRPELARIGTIQRTDGGQLDPESGDLRLTAGWGHAGQGGVTMPGKGKSVERPYTPEEGAALGDGTACLGATTRDVYLNGVAFWQNVPSGVWDYTIGGYQVLKKWLSYREAPLLGRGLTPAEVKEVTAMTRRLAALRLLEPALDTNYGAVKAAAFGWEESTSLAETPIHSWKMEGEELTGRRDTSPGDKSLPSPSERRG